MQIRIRIDKWDEKYIKHNICDHVISMSELDIANMLTNGLNIEFIPNSDELQVQIQHKE